MQRLINDDEKIESLKNDFAKNAFKYDYTKVDSFNYVIGYIGKSQDQAEWRIWKTIESPSNARDVEYIGKSYKSFEKAYGDFKDLTGQNNTVVDIRRKTKGINKSVSTYSEGGDWALLAGMKLQVNNDGTVIKGPDIFIGQKYEDLSRTSYNDVFSIMNLWNQANVQNYSMSYEDSLDKKKKERLKKEAKELLKKAIQNGKNSRPY